MPDIPELPFGGFASLPDLNSPEEQVIDALNAVAIALTCIAHDIRAIRENAVKEPELTPET